MIDLSPEDIAEFQSLHRRETGRAITEAEARAYALSIIELVSFVVRKGKQSAQQHESGNGGTPPAQTA